ncbi:MAG: hypothetical protein IJS81_07635 [Selenomonadaceae bacterium]|nr:hypothetical protein [Selenomonadaceae bacterium]MBQ7630067.1 hypothetical protein [Selenomonadaceae bacterium]
MSGLDLAKTVGLKICECKSKFEPMTCEISLNELEKILQNKFKNSRAIFVAWQVQSIIWGTYDGEKLSSSEIKHWLECRIFNDAEELHLKKLNNKFVGRYVNDVEGVGNFYVDSFARFWGEKISAANGYIKLLDRSRKLYMEIPCAENNSKWYGLLTRNYIDSDESTGLSGYVDYRFVAIEPAKAGDDIG